MRTTQHIVLRVAEIISTEKRKEIMNVIIAHTDDFTVADVFGALKDKRIDIKITSVLNVVKSLHYAGFLTEKVETKSTRKEGRPKNLYRKVSGITVTN